jgi:protein-L-isoaspartate(D-aspartate) O-methyltransferase
MLDFAAARRMMVDGQVRTSDVTDLRVTTAMLELPRERFLPAAMAPLAYLDRDVPAIEPGEGPQRCLLKPMVLAKLVQAAEVGAGDRVLDVGCATGYSTALLARLTGEVVALEQQGMLAQRARENLVALGAGNVEVVISPLAAGWPARAPYDVILLNGATEVVPEALLHQLRDGGRLACIMGRSPAGKAMLFRGGSGHAGGVAIFDASAPVLPGFSAAPAFVF